MKQLERLSAENGRLYLSKYLQGILEIERLVDVENYLFALLYFTADMLKHNVFIETANEDCIEDWENFLSIPSSDLSLDERRLEVLKQLNVRYILTEVMLKSEIAALMYDIDYDIDVDHKQLIVTIHTKNIDNDEEVERLEKAKSYLQQILPLNLELQLQLSTTAESSMYIALQPSVCISAQTSITKN